MKSLSFPWYMHVDTSENWSQCYKTFFMLYSVEQEILNAHKYENIKKFSILQAQISL